MKTKIPNNPIKTAFIPCGYMDGIKEFRVYAERNGLVFGHIVGSKKWNVLHGNTGKPIGCAAKINFEAKTKVAAFFEYMADFPCAWDEWTGNSEPPAWRYEAEAYRNAYQA